MFGDTCLPKSRILEKVQIIPIDKKDKDDNFFMTIAVQLGRPSCEEDRGRR